MNLVQNNRIASAPTCPALRDLLKGFLDKLFPAASVKSGEERYGIRCRTSKFPLAFGEAVSFQSGRHKP